MVMIAVRTVILLLIVRCASSAFAQDAPVSPYRPWHGVEERDIANDPKLSHESRFSVEPNRVYSLSELIDLAQTHHPDTRIAWEGARAQLAAWGLARSELYPTL